MYAKNLKKAKIILVVYLIATLALLFLGYSVQMPRVAQQEFPFTITYSYQGETQNISDIYVYIHDENGSEVYKHAVRARVPSTREMKISKVVDLTETWGSLDDLNPEKEDYTLTIEVQLGTGERPVVYTGKYLG